MSSIVYYQSPDFYIYSNNLILSDKIQNEIPNYLSNIIFLNSINLSDMFIFSYAKYLGFRNLYHLKPLIRFD